MKKVRYAVVGLGKIAQDAVLPAFVKASKNAQLTALVSGDAEKCTQLAKRYGVTHTYDYAEYETCLRSGNIDAVYICLPNSMHAEFSNRAARAGIHVLCEKPMASNIAECERMIHVADASRVKLMIAYRLHFEPANRRVKELVQQGRIGDPRFFSASFSHQVGVGDIRTQAALGGGPIWDIGIYCINAARTVFGAEPVSVTAAAASNDDARFAEVPEMVTASLRFPNDRLAQLVCSFGAEKTSRYSVVGTGGEIRVDPAFGYDTELKYRLTHKGRTTERTYRARDQFALEIVRFSQNILDDTLPETGGLEGFADVRVIEAIMRSISTGRTISLAPVVLQTHTLSSKYQAMSETQKNTKRSQNVN